MSQQVIPCIKLQRPEWYLREDFRAWFKRRTLAKWWPDPASEYADCFFSVDYNPDFLGYDFMEGSDLEDGNAHDPAPTNIPDGPPQFSANLPPDCIADLKAVLRDLGITYALIWLQNCP